MMPNSAKTQPKLFLAPVLAIAFAAPLVSTTTLQAAVPPTKAQDGPTITPNYKDADLSQIIQAVGEVTGKNFIIDPRVNAKVTMVSATPMSPSAFYEAFLSVLQVYGYVAVPAGKVIKIIPNTDARQVPANDLPLNVSATSDEVVTQIVQVKNISAAQLVPLLRPLIPQYGHLAAYPTGNMLIISDRASNVSRIVRIVERMDESGEEPIEVIPLHNASAADVVRDVNSLNQGQGEGGGAAVKIVADERTNSILLTGEKSQRLRLKAVMINMDTPLATGGDTQVRYLRYADAEKLADKLKGQATASAKAQGGPPTGGPGGGGGGANVDASVTIWADVATNALVITAPPKLMRSLMSVIDRLDIRRAQVLVEAIIVEVDVNKSSNIGVQWIIAGGSSAGDGIVNLPGGGTSIVDIAAAAIGATSNNLNQTAIATTSNIGTTGVGATGISSATFGTGATFALGTFNSTTDKGFAALIQALRSDADSNIISTPSLVTMNNEEAEVHVTQEIPLVTGSYASSTQSTNGTTSPFTTIQREEVGTILKVTPHINEGNSVQLKIEQEDSAPGAKLADSADISTNKRSIKTTVLMQDGSIIVLGGLMQDTVTESEDRVPGLGAIPLIGNLFKSRSGSRMKSDLLVFIRPQILRDSQAIEDVSEEKYNGIRRQEKELNNGHIMLLPGQKQPAIPPVPPGAGRPVLPPPDANVQGAVPNYPAPPTAMPPSTATPAPEAPPATPPPATAAPQPAPSQHP
jgi:general secretion pathway protein D